jgi:aerobic C4-dicarboxylate transport protein
VMISVLFGVVLSKLGDSAKPVRDVVDGGSKLVFGAINIIMKLAPIGAFGAMAFTVGRYGISSLGPLAFLIGTFYLTSVIFVVGVLGVIAWFSGFSIFRFLAYIKEEILIVLGTSSSDSALPSLMAKLERLGCSKPVVGLVLPTGYVFNTDGTSIYMTLAALFVAQATNTDLTLTQQLTLLAVAMLTSKGASGVTGASFIALVGTLSVVPTIPVAGMALILGIDRFMSEARALVNMQGRRMKSSSQKREHILIVPGGLLATGPHADPGCSVLAHEVDGDLAQDGQIASCRSIPDAAVILPERDIQDPMEPIFNRPVPADRLNQHRGIIAAA